MNPREKIARLLSPLLDVALRSRTTVKFFLTLGIFISANHLACTTSWTGSTGLPGGEAAVASSFFFLVFAYYVTPEPGRSWNHRIPAG